MEVNIVTLQIPLQFLYCHFWSVLSSLKCFHHSILYEMMTDYGVEQPRYRITVAQQSKFGWEFSLFCNQLFNPYFASSLNHFHSVTARICKRKRHAGSNTHHPWVRSVWRERCFLCQLHYTHSWTKLKQMLSDWSYTVQMKMIPQFVFSGM